MSGRTQADSPQVARRAMAGRRAVGLPLALVSLLTGCEGLLEVEDASDPVLLEGLGPVSCPPGWTGDALPASLQAHLDEALSAALQDVQHLIDSEAQLRNIGGMTSVRVDDLVLHTTSATEILSSQTTLGFLEELRIYVEPTRVDSKLGPALLARHDQISETATAIILEPTRVNLEPYFAEGFRARAEVTPRTCLSADLHLRLSFHARVRYQDE